LHGKSCTNSRKKLIKLGFDLILLLFNLDPRRSGAGGAGGESDCFRLVKLIMENDWAPAIVFSFSKKECEAYALQMSKLDFNTRKVTVLKNS